MTEEAGDEPFTSGPWPSVNERNRRCEPAGLLHQVRVEAHTRASMKPGALQGDSRRLACGPYIEHGDDVGPVRYKGL